MLDQYDFNETLARLDDIHQWLKSLGFTSLDRVRVYRDSIRRMLEFDANGGVEALQESIPLARAREIYWSYIDSDEFVRAVDSLRESCGDSIAAGLIDLIEKVLRGPADLLLETTNNSGGRNFMFELIMAGRLASAGLHPSFDKGADVHAEFGGCQLAVQCKRPFSEKGLEKNIGKAIHQLKQTNAELKLIAVSVSRLLNTGDPNDMAEVPDRSLGHTYLQARVERIAEKSKRFWHGKMDNAGILFYAFASVRCADKPSFFFDRCENMYPLRPGEEPASTLLTCLAQILGT